MCGFFQVNISIFKPLFVDTFSTSRNISYRMSSILLTPSIGVLGGYGITGYFIMKYEDWRLSFSIMSVMMFAMAGFLSTVPSKFLNLNKVQEMKRMRKK